MTARTDTLPLLAPDVQTLPEVQEAQALAVQPAPLDMTSPLGLMAYALQMGQTGALRELVELKRGMDADAARVAFHQDFLAFQAEAPALKRIKAGLTTKTKQVVAYFDPLDNMLRELRPVLLRHNFTVRHEQDPLSETVSKVTCVLTHRLGHEARSSFLARQEGTELANKSQQMAGGVTTAKRITLKAVLGLEEEKADQDFNNCQEDNPFMPAGDVREILQVAGELTIDEPRLLKYLGVDKPERILQSMDTRIRELFAKRRGILLDQQAAGEGSAR